MWRCPKTVRAGHRRGTVSRRKRETSKSRTFGHWWTCYVGSPLVRAAGGSGSGTATAGTTGSRSTHQTASLDRCAALPAWRSRSPTLSLRALECSTGRDYLLYSGAPDDALVFVNIENQSPNLWWPEDRSWCVATEIDLHYTYIGAPRDLIHRLLAHPVLEAQEVPAEQSFHLRSPDWVRQLAADTVDELMNDRQVTLDLWPGTVQARLRHSSWGGARRWTIEVETTTADGHGLSRQPLSARHLEAARDELTEDLAGGIVDLVL